MYDDAITYWIKDGGRNALTGMRVIPMEYSTKSNGLQNRES